MHVEDGVEGRGRDVLHVSHAIKQTVTANEAMQIVVEVFEGYPLHPRNRVLDGVVASGREVGPSCDVRQESIDQVAGSM